MPTAATHLWAGILTLADWFGSTTEAFPFAPEADSDVEAYWVRARERAINACRVAGLIPRTKVVVSQGSALLKTLFPSVFPRF